MRKFVDLQISRLLAIVLATVPIVPTKAGEPPGISEIVIDSGSLMIDDRGIVFEFEGKKTIYEFGNGVSVPFWSLSGATLSRISPESADLSKGGVEINWVEIRSLNGNVKIRVMKDSPVKVYRVSLKTYEFPSGFVHWVPQEGMRSTGSVSTTSTRSTKLDKRKVKESKSPKQHREGKD